MIDVLGKCSPDDPIRTHTERPVCWPSMNPSINENDGLTSSPHSTLGRPNVFRFSYARRSACCTSVNISLARLSCSHLTTLLLRPAPHGGATFPSPSHHSLLSAASSRFPFDLSLPPHLGTFCSGIYTALYGDPRPHGVYGPVETAPSHHLLRLKIALIRLSSSEAFCLAQPLLISLGPRPHLIPPPTDPNPAVASHGDHWHRREEPLRFVFQQQLQP